MNDEEFGSVKLLKLKFRRVDQIIQTFCRIGSPQKLGPPSVICRNFKSLTKKSSESYRTHGNLMNEEEFGSLKVLKSKHRRGDQIIEVFFRSAWFLPRNQAPSIQAIQLFCKIGFPPHPWKLGSLLNLRKFQKTGEKYFESCKIYYLEIYEEFGSK